MRRSITEAASLNRTLTLTLTLTRDHSNRNYNPAPETATGRWIPVDADVQKMMDCFDTDHDGWLDFAEVCGVLGTEPWVKAFPRETRGGLDAAVARVLREWQAARADPVLTDRLHRTAKDIQNLEAEKIERDAMINADREETMRRWEMDKFKLQQEQRARDAYMADSVNMSLQTSFPGLGGRLVSSAAKQVSRAARAEAEYYELLQEQAKRLGMGGANAGSNSVLSRSVSGKMQFATDVVQNNESAHGHARAAEDAEETALRQRVAFLESQIADLESPDVRLSSNSNR